MSWHARAKMGRSLRWEVSPGAGKCPSTPAVQNPIALGCQAAPAPAQHAHTLSVGTNRSKSSGQSPEGDFYLQFTEISYLCKHYFKANNLWSGEDTGQACVKQARSDLQTGKTPGFVL